MCMMNKHVKSPCCNASVRRYGKRRRQCIKCKSTWRIRQKKRGRKRLRPNQSLLFSLLKGRRTCFSAAEDSRSKVSKIEKRCQRARDAFIIKTKDYFFPEGKLILIVDGLWAFFRGKGRYTLYLMAVKNSSEPIAHFFDPILLPGRESLEGWRTVMTTIPEEARKRICVVVSDGLRGFKAIAEENRWAFQRCHFHLIASFQRKHGQYFQVGKNRWIRDAILAYIQKILDTTDKRQLLELQKELTILSCDQDCPRYLSMRVREFLRTRDDFLTYLLYPKMNIPITTNTMETMIRLLRKLLKQMRGTRIPESLLKWTTSYIRFKRTITCNGKKSTKLIL